MEHDRVLRDVRREDGQDTAAAEPPSGQPGGERPDRAGELRVTEGIAGGHVANGGFAAERLGPAQDVPGQGSRRDHHVSQAAGEYCGQGPAGVSGPRRGFRCGHPDPSARDRTRQTDRPAGLWAAASENAQVKVGAFW